VLDLPNGLARGVRTASDFLMAMQLTGAAKGGSIANMQLRLPVVVVGGRVDCDRHRTESLAYYPLQVEKFLKRYERLGTGTRRGGRPHRVTRGAWSSRRILAHARALRSRGMARPSPRTRLPRTLELLQSWGGVTIDLSPAVDRQPVITLNHEKVHKAGRRASASPKA